MRFFETIDREGRFGEWMAALAMLEIGIVLALPGDTMRFSEWWYLRGLGLAEVQVAVLAGSIGAARMVALWINGAWRRTPILRGIGSCVGVIFFLGMAASSAGAWVLGDVRAPDMNAALYLLLALADLRGVYRAGMDHDAAKLSA